MTIYYMIKVPSQSGGGGLRCQPYPKTSPHRAAITAKSNLTAIKVIDLNMRVKEAVVPDTTSTDRKETVGHIS